MSKQKPAAQEPKRQNRVRSAGEMVGDIAGLSFKRFGFVQGAIVSRWTEIVGERYARVSTPESIRFPAGRKVGGTLTLLVEGAHAPLLQHLAPTITERVNRFFGYQAVAKIAFRRGAAAKSRPRPARPEPVPVPTELGEGLRAIADPGLRACLESLASSLAASKGPPLVERGPILPNPINRPE
ncbi:DUF721 domain-containing protein [Sphingomonas sp. GCM10030256]|uniref:DUF721 domain-containing protein n=1 Tax=Sphingomonas sp. GCM10030256 TaxID=3273427 RepID=UPI00360711DA